MGCWGGESIISRALATCVMPWLHKLGRGINNQQSIGNLCNAMAAQIRTPTTDDKNMCSQEKLLFRVQKDHLFEEKSPLEILTVHRHSEKMLSTLGTHLVMH